MNNLKKSLKNRIIISIAILFVAYLLFSVKDNIKLGVTIVKYSYAIVLPYMLVCIARLLKNNTQEANKKIIKDSIILYCIVKVVCFIFRLIISENFNTQYFGITCFLNWIFIAVPIYILILDKFEDNIKLLPYSFILPMILTYDGSISYELFRNVVCFFPFFIFGWNFDCIKEKLNNKGILLCGIGFGISLILSYFKVRQYSVAENLFEQYVLVFFSNKIILYALPILFSITTEGIISKIGILNKDYKFNIVNAFCGMTIVYEIICQYNYQKYADGRRFILGLTIIALALTVIFAKMPIDKIITKKPSKDEIKQPKNRFEGFLNSSISIIVLVFILMLKTIMFYKNTVFKKEEIPLIILGYNLGYILVLLIPIFLTRSNKARLIEIIIWNLIISTVLFADELYFSYCKMVLSINQIYNIKYVQEITSVATNLLKIRQILYFIDIIFMIIAVAIIKFKNLKKLTNRSYVRSAIAAVIILYIFTNDIINLGTTINISNYSNDYQVQACTIYGFHITDIQNFINNKKHLRYKSKTEINNAYNKLKDVYSKYTEDYRGIAKDKNVIIVQLEAIQEFLYRAKINDKEITPYLNEFLDENIHFTNMHAQSYTTTADSEFSVASSLYPLDNGLSFAKYFNVDYDDIYSVLQENGYYTAFFHGNNAQFWNRGRVYKEFGLDEANFRDSFNEQENVMWYLSDRVLYKESVEKMENYREPFMANIVSASSHTPFTLLDLDKSILTIDVGKYKDTFFGDYLEAANYADMQFGYFINMLKENGMYDNSVIVVFGDHYGMPISEEGMLNFFRDNGHELNSIEDLLNFTNVLGGIHVPGLDAQIIDKPVSKIDVKPTILSLLSIKDDFSLGVSFFSNKEFVCTNVGTIITKDKYYDSVKWFDIRSAEEVNISTLDNDEKKLLEEYIDCMNLELNISKSYPVVR